MNGSASWAFVTARRFGGVQRGVAAAEARRFWGGGVRRAGCGASSVAGAASASAPENMPSMRLRISAIRAASSASISSVLSSALLALSTGDCLRTHSGGANGWPC